jgi:hypothetical protein
MSSKLSFLTVTVCRAVPVLAQFSSYDACVFPEEAGDGWFRIVQPEEFISDRFLDDCWLVQTPGIADQGPPLFWQQDYYRRNIPDQVGAEHWQMTWIVESDGPLLIGAVAPASIVAGGTAGVLYHFTIGADQVAFLRDAQIPLIVADFEPGMHLFNLELRNDVEPPTYAFSIDGQIIDSGVAEGIYPSSGAAIVFGTQAAQVPNTTRWDLVEFGAIVSEPIAGDSDGDGDVDLVDLAVFQTCLSDSGPGEPPLAQGCLESGDFDHDGDVDVTDYGGFQMSFTGAL